ncbi:PREDICTED: EF-hand calcium-binding domain-containing protein 9-like [Amphimedon queenslandica]|uniref:EF-hand domain-containing protein n=2 Tax=Amphimedon queenslandica TaxID=400682 RepID=A0AAN0IFS5_AMPQE|nr:PREDICTED: EF-hand calcium-binding domain-containing protein 9-like [Amphimedon queenslandica]|eukprot:XP_003387680.1 PREDICTED: EF-hand calcium-binding domain-containing protein 9-like [Amphimedon queenslandica]
MKVLSSFLNSLHLDPSYCLLSVYGVTLVLHYYRSMDIRTDMTMDDVQFEVFLKSVTDLSSEKVYRVFDMLDVDCSGVIDFDGFYLLVCILVSIKDGMEKQFISCHSRTLFDLLDRDADGNISVKEFERFGFLFNLTKGAIKEIFKEFDVSGDEILDYNEFQMFIMACVDKQKEIEAQRSHIKEWLQMTLCTLL